MRNAHTPFSVDQQTWKDLGLFDQGRRGPVFDLFNRTRTEGGEQALERMLKHPSNRRALLEGRRDTIRFFRDRNIDLPVGHEQLKRIEHYLSACVPLFPDVWSKALFYNAANQLRQRPAYTTIVTGVRTTVSLLRQVFSLRAAWLKEDCPALMAEELAGLPDLINDAYVRSLLLGPGKHLKLLDLARCDHFFREAGKPCIRHLLHLLYGWDAYQAVAEVSRQYDLSFPRYDGSPGSRVKAEGLFHPLVAGAVPNDHEMGQDANLFLITGPGRSGRSTFMRSFGLAVYLAHLGFPVPARSLRTTLFNGLITAIDLTDSISQGYSHFYAEVQRMKDILYQVGEMERVVVIIDELFHGTNAKDGADASRPVIDALAGIEGSLFLISTHIPELADALQGDTRFRFACFGAMMDGGVPWYNYTLQEGVANQRIGIMMLRSEGVLEILEELQVRRVSRDPR